MGADFCRVQHDFFHAILFGIFRNAAALLRLPAAICRAEHDFDRRFVVFAGWFFADVFLFYPVSVQTGKSADESVGRQNSGVADSFAAHDPQF